MSHSDIRLESLRKAAISSEVIMSCLLVEVCVGDLQITKDGAAIWYAMLVRLLCYDETGLVDVLPCNSVETDKLITSLTWRFYGQRVEDCLAPFRTLNLVRPPYCWSTQLSVSTWLVLLKLLRCYNVPSFVQVKVITLECDDL